MHLLPLNIVLIASFLYSYCFLILFPLLFSNNYFLFPKKKRIVTLSIIFVFWAITFAVHCLLIIMNLICYPSSFSFYIYPWLNTLKSFWALYCHHVWINRKGVFSLVLISKYIIFSGEDGRSRAELLMLILRQIDQFISSPVEYQRKRGCLAVHELLIKFRMVCVSGYCALGCHGNCVHTKQIDRTLYGNFSKLPCKYVPSDNFEF
jgi:hypothetical protein